MRAYLYIIIKNNLNHVLVIINNFGKFRLKIAVDIVCSVTTNKIRREYISNSKKQDNLIRYELLMCGYNLSILYAVN